MSRWLTAVRAAVFALLLCALLTGATRLLRMKESEEQIGPFLQSAQEYDVLFAGDSQVYYGIAPLEIYRDYGITSYNLGVVNSTLAMTYWTVMNALDYAKPKAVVVGVKDAEYPLKLSGKFGHVHTACDAFPLTPTKLQAVFDLTDTEQTDAFGTTAAELRLDLIAPLLKYHSRWNSLKPEDFSPRYNTQKGAKLQIHVTDPDESQPLIDPASASAEEGWGYVYLRRLIETCRERGIGLLLVMLPHRAGAESQRSGHTVAAIAAETGTDYLNFIDMDRVVDYYTDCFDPASHLNPSGVRKVSDYLGRYLRDVFGLPDHRGEAAFAGWERDYDAYIDEKLRAMQEQEDGLRSALMLLHDRDFNCVLTFRPGFDTSQLHIKNLLQNIARENVHWDDDKVSADLNPLEGLQYADGEGAGYFLAVDRDRDEVHELYGRTEREFETSFGTVFCRMDGEWIDLSLTDGGEETYYFDTWEEQDEDLHLLVIDRRTGKPVLRLTRSLP